MGMRIRVFKYIVFEKLRVIIYFFYNIFNGYLIKDDIITNIEFIM